MNKPRLHKFLIWGLLFCISPAWALEGTALSNHGVILTYHHVAEDTPASTSIRPKQFSAHLNYLAENGYTVWPLEQMSEQLRKGLSIPQRTVALTFDDAYTSVFEHAHPQLAVRGWPYTVFVSTKAIDENHKPYMSWSQITQLANAGVDIGNHSHQHDHLLQRLPKETDPAWLSRISIDITLAQRRIKAKTGREPKLFAYPYGEYSKKLAALVTDMGMVGFGQHSGVVGHHSDFGALPRFPLGGSYTDLDTLAIRLNAQPLWVTETPAGPQIMQRKQAVDWLTLRLAPGPYQPARLTCYASNQGLMDMQSTNDAHTVRIRPQEPFSVGRSKYNCTAPHVNKKGVFLWWSYLIMTLQADGTWYSG